MENDNDLSQLAQEPEVKTQDTPEVPPVRDASFYYQQRQKEKAQKVSETDTEDLDTLVNQKVEERLGTLTATLDKSTREQEARDFFMENPEFVPYKDKILAWGSDTSRKHLPLSSVAFEAVGKENLAKIYGEKALAQEREARQSRVGGGVIRRDAGATSKLSVDRVNSMTDAELDAAIKQHM